VLLFDGECGLCNRVVRALMRRDRAGVLRYAPLQGPTAQAYLRARGLPTAEFSSLVFIPDLAEANGLPLLRTDGARAALARCGRVGRFWAAVLGIFPRRLCDAAYVLVARTRYFFFGTWVPRPLPDPSWAERLLP
jgi:predicted DCC family thiol-disulfide oxidoreductase YuxK